MKIAVTGHTGLLGRNIYSMFDTSEHTVIGMSRTTGFNLETDYHTCIQILKTCDIVFNNAHAGTVQARIIQDLVETNNIVITSGSEAANYDIDQYCLDKCCIHSVYYQCRQYYPNRCLLLKMGYLNENHQNLTPINIQEILNGIQLFLSNRRITMIEYLNI